MGTPAVTVTLLTVFDPAWTPNQTPAAMPTATPVTISNFVVVLMPRPTFPPEKFVCVITAEAVIPLKEALTRIVSFPVNLFGCIPGAEARPFASVVKVRVWEPLAKVPLGPELGRKKTTAAPAAISVFGTLGLCALGLYALPDLRIFTLRMRDYT